ncbi:MAG: exodeoxyribonuclease VII large subunit [Aureispira sp.]|nr:exodeoxyribonuclease VII large subunit [Aureispira sp.]
MQNTNSNTPQQFSLFELNQHLHRVVAFNMRQPIWIRCELADVSNSRGNLYLSLVDRDEYKVRAKANAVFWKSDQNRVHKKIGDSLWTILQAGSQVLMEVLVEFTELYGFQLIVKNVDLSFTVGQLELQRIATMRKLEADQFFDLNKQLDFNIVPQRIAVISSKTAAGLQDFLNQLHQNPYGYTFRTELFAAAMQGANVETEVVQQIEIIEARQTEFDCIVIVRGGGARLDLMGFDSYKLCVAIATSELPIITGIGHDIDEVLADLVAHQALKTPTAAAEFLVNQVLNFEATLEQTYLQITQFAQHHIQQAQVYLETTEQKLGLLVQQHLNYHTQLLQNLEEKAKLLDPQNTLDRGFSIVTNQDGKVLNTIEEAKSGDILKIRFGDGDIEVVVR